MARNNHAVVHRLAANRSGQELISETLDRMSALLAQHQILSDRWSAELLEITCRCEACTEYVELLTDNLVTVSRSRQRLLTAGDAIAEINGSYPAPEPREVERFMATIPGGDDEAGQ